MSQRPSPLRADAIEVSDSPDRLIPTTAKKDAAGGDNDGKLKPDVEKNAGSKAPEDANLVSWESTEDPANPKNWSFGRKWAAAFVVSSFAFISPVSASMVAPALPTLKAQFHITNSVVSQIFMAIFVLAYALGPLFLGPLSEIYGRAPVLQLANLFYLVFNTACGAANSTTQMAVFRFLAGLGGSAPLSVHFTVSPPVSQLASDVS